MHDFSPGLTGDERIHAARRHIAIDEIKQHIGQIDGLEGWADSAIFGLRDSIRTQLNLNAEQLPDETDDNA